MEINNNNFNNSPFVFGEGNKINYSSDDYQIDWDRFRTEIKMILKKLPQDSMEFTACTELLVESASNDNKKISPLLKKYLPQFTSDLFSSFASTFLSDLLWKLLNK